ncbi:hypothetical protein CSB20_14435 [bacterium DOLZORAL124_64_63]|nr:MAG: hypothetical protein CSB20_14435 [bacterium DOLZORAL124_64_63]
MQKRNNGMIIRLVDVVLIVLFGFLMISKIQQQVEIPLPHSKGENIAAQTDKDVFDVFIRRDGRIQCGWIDSKYQVQMPLDNSDQDFARARYNELKTLIADANPHKIPVAIQAEFDSPTQFTVDMLDICKELGMQKSLTCFEMAKPGTGGEG